jgi:hypothetical protein
MSIDDNKTAKMSTNQPNDITVRGQNMVVAESAEESQNQ